MKTFKTESHLVNYFKVSVLECLSHLDVLSEPLNERQSFPQDVALSLLFFPSVLTSRTH